MLNSFLVSLITIIGVMTLTNYIAKMKKKSHKPSNSKFVPFVEGSLPFVGHGLTFSKDKIGFIRKAYQKYGKIFRIKIFSKTMTVVCDHNMKQEFFQATEDSMSLYESLKDLFFSDAFSDDPSSMSNMITIVKGTIAIRYEDFIPKIKMQAERMTERIKQKSGRDRVDLKKEMMRFVIATSAQCFASMELSDEFVDLMLNFSELLNRIIVMTYMIPRWILRILTYFSLRRYRKTLIKLLEPEIQKYRDDPEKTDSLIFRKGVDFIDKKTGKHLSNEEVGSIVICLLYISSENTAFATTICLLDLSLNPEYWEKVAKETLIHLAQNDIKSLLSAPLLDSCVHETARMNTHLFVLIRKPMKPNCVIGGYFVGDSDAVTVCHPMMSEYDSATNFFADPQKYNPSRFLPPNNESKLPMSVTTWGAGIHLCPGKMFALYEIKLALVYVLNNFQRPDIYYVDPNAKEYLSPSAFAERSFITKLVKLEKNKIDEIAQSNNVYDIVHNDKKYKVQYYKQGGWLIRNYFTPEEQIEYYKYTVQLSKESQEQKQISSTSPEKPFSLTYYNLIHTGKSNCDTPKLWFDMAESVWRMLVQNSKMIQFPISNEDKHGFDFMHTRMFKPESILKQGKDEYDTWCISINIGASCDSQFGDERLRLNSGDIFIGDLSKVTHSIEKVHEDLVPRWFSNEADETSSFDDIETFGYIGCNIHIQNSSRY